MPDPTPPSLVTFYSDSTEARVSGQNTMDFRPRVIEEKGGGVDPKDSSAPESVNSSADPEAPSPLPALTPIQPQPSPEKSAPVAKGSRARGASARSTRTS